MIYVRAVVDEQDCEFHRLDAQNCNVYRNVGKLLITCQRSFDVEELLSGACEEILKSERAGRKSNELSPAAAAAAAMNERAAMNADDVDCRPTHTRCVLNYCDWRIPAAPLFLQSGLPFSQHHGTLARLSITAARRRDLGNLSSANRNCADLAWQNGRAPYSICRPPRTYFVDIFDLVGRQ